jgi:hypothetical protein
MPEAAPQFELPYGAQPPAFMIRIGLLLGLSSSAVPESAGREPGGQTTASAL